MDYEKKIVPATIMRAETDELRLLRDISIVLSSMYISKDNRIRYIAEYFKLKEKEVEIIISKCIKNNPIEILEYQDELKDTKSIYLGWDIKNNCELTFERLQEIKIKECKFSLNDFKKYNWFTPFSIPMGKS